MKKLLWLGALVLLATGGPAVAGKGNNSTPITELTGENGWTATPVMTTDDVATLSDWSGFSSVSLDFAMENSSSHVYSRVDASDDSGVYTGVVEYDGTGPVSVLKVGPLHHAGTQFAPNWDEGTFIESITIVPSDAGPLKQDDLLVAEFVADTKTWDGTEWTGDNWVKIVRYPADSSASGGIDVSGAPDVLFSYDAVDPGSWVTALAVDGSGNVFLTQHDLLDSSGATLDSAAIRKLSYGGGGISDYTDGVLTTDAGDSQSSLGRFLVGFSNGYVFGEGNWDYDQGTYSGDILEIDPDSGSDSVYGSYPGNSTEQDPLVTFGFDGAGSPYASIDDVIRERTYISEVPAGGEVSYRSRIADTPATGAADRIAPRSAGGMWVISTAYDYSATNGLTLRYTALYSLTPSPSGGSGGGGGHGQGKH